MSFPLSLLLFGAGVAIVIPSAERLVKATVGTSAGFGLSAFLISVVFIGFDAENLALGAVASWEEMPGIALGTIVGSAMVAVALALGITALVAPLRFDAAPIRVLAVPAGALLLLPALAADGHVTRLDGTLLLAGYAAAVVYLLVLEQRGDRIVATDARQSKVERLAEGDRWRAAGLMLLTLVGVVVGSELALAGAEGIMTRFGLTDTVFGMTVLALVVSFEEVARELPAALQGRPDITAGNVVGSILAFFLFNAGVIALVRPLAVSEEVLRFHLPAAVGTGFLVLAFLLRRSVPRWAGGILVLLYAGFFVGAWRGGWLP